jgi:ribosomal protein S1
MAKFGLIVLLSISSYTFSFTSINIFGRNLLNSKSMETNLINNNIMFKGRTWMTMTTEKVEVATPENDYSKYFVGQELEGTAVSAKAFGIFVNIATNTNVLLPKSVLSKSTYDKLKSSVEKKANETVRIELIGVSAENKTLSGKYIPLNFKNRPDISLLEGKDLSSRFFNATVVSSHDFGIFVEIHEFGVEGLVPASKLPSVLPKSTIQTSYL